MKKLITLALIISATTFTQAQSNLVFNQVLNFNIGIGETVTVPDGKAWKLESAISVGNVLISSTNQEYGNNLDSSNVAGYPAQTYPRPLWLGQGTSLTYNNSSVNNYLSILEFNVEPISTTTGGSGGGVSADGFTAIGIVNIQFNDSRPAIDNHLMGTITVPEGEIWKITDANILRSSVAFGSFNNGNYLINNATHTFIGTHQFPNPNGYTRPARYLTEGSYEVRSWEANGLNGSGSQTMYYQAMINGIKYSAN